jgi:hypothetical protein
MQNNPQKYAGKVDLIPATGNAPRWLVPDSAFWKQFLLRPELAPLEESCEAELALHASLLADPTRAVSPAELQALQDDDVRDSYELFVRFRDRLLAAGTLESYYLSLFPVSPANPGKGQSRIDMPPLFIDLTVEAILNHLMPAATSDAWELRAAHMLYRSQRISTRDGQVLSGDLQTLDMLHETGGAGLFGRFLAESGVPLPTLDMQVLGEDNAAVFLNACAGRKQALQHSYLLDLRHEVSNDLSHGLVLTMTRAHSGLKALSVVLQKWIGHFLGVEVTIRPLQKIDDAAWRWHVGLDAPSMLLLNDLYEGIEVEPERLQQLVSLFRLDFADPQDMRPDVAGKPVYLGMMMNAAGVLQLKPQNLLSNLPLRNAV